MLRAQVVDIILGTVFVSFGLAALMIAAIRDRREIRILLWLGIWSAMYGGNLLLRSPAVVAELPALLRAAVPFTRDAIGYLVLVVGLLAWSELTLGKMRVFTLVMVVPSLVVGLAGIALFVVTGSGQELIPYNNLLAGMASLVLTTVVVVPKLSARFLASDSRVLVAGALVFAAEALYRNVENALKLPRLRLPWADELGFAAFLFSFAYVAARKVFASEKRLVAIESELEVARRIQTSILPTSIPQVEGLRIAATYQPMAAVGGDFYEFIPVDEHRIGFLIADVSGHGVPAALIASMIKVGAQTIAPCAASPATVLCGLNRILSGQLRGMLVSAAYLWVDTEAQRALYSAAGHPPLLRWNRGVMRQIESNGLLFGVLPDGSYPVREIALEDGDRFLLCTDGVFEPENAAGVAFGESRLEQAVRENELRAPEELCAGVMAEVRRWQPAGTEQQDDMTLVAIDVL